MATIKTVSSKTELSKDESEERKMHSTIELTPLAKHEKRNKKRFLIAQFLLLFVIGNLLFSTILGLSNATTSLLPEDNLGVIGLTVSNASEMITSLTLIALINNLWGIKRILTFSAFIIVLYPVSFFYPVSYIFIFGSMVRGAGFALILTSIYIYGSKMINRYHEDVGGNRDVLMVIMSGLNYSSIGGGYLFGNILEYTILNTQHTFNITENENNVCGANYCNEDLTNLTIVQPPSKDKYYTLIGVYTGLILLAGILSLLLVDFPCEPRKNTIFKEFFNAMKITFKQLIDPRGYLLIVITIFIGVKESFLIAVFTFAYVNCMLGIAHIGEVMFAFGIGQIIMSFCNWIPVKIIKRIPTLALGCLIIISCYLTMLFYPFTTTNYLSATYTVLVFIYAIAASMIATTTFSMYALLFPEVEASFGIAFFWWALGAMIFNGTNRLFCLSVKLYLIITLVVVSFLLFSYLEYLIHKGKFSSSSMKQN